MHRQILPIIDANINRASEGLRVLEDIARFILHDSSASEELKASRHYLNGLAHKIGTVLLEARDADADVGADFDLTLEHADAASVVRANAKRAQESLRVLEEFSKVRDLELSHESGAIKKLRYKIYTFEKNLISGLSKPS